MQRNEVKGRRTKKEKKRGGREGEQEEEEEEASGDGGSIKESTLRYNKVHPRKPSALFAPALSPTSLLAAAALRHPTYFVPQLY